MALSLKKYLASALKWLIPFALLEVLLVVIRNQGMSRLSVEKGECDYEMSLL